ncbi:hypothetical protein SKAU_G00346490 [Synaphobranchus kaupii]|uniref:Uncharacterized protein n=1 Tax=Synaphobranchus kaupii TaxID=118154 RepID=A0A9Q1EJJ6_SYNKA|nr:hypothetical protein SKAU_G00346490 [Synaphobranchus kaupii]
MELLFSSVQKLGVAGDFVTGLQCVGLSRLTQSPDGPRRSRRKRLCSVEISTLHPLPTTHSTNVSTTSTSPKQLTAQTGRSLPFPVQSQPSCAPLCYLQEGL